MKKLIKSAFALVIEWLDKYIPTALDPSDPSEGDMIPDYRDYDGFDWYGDRYQSNG